jgi:predicted acyl esterase
MNRMALFDWLKGRKTEDVIENVPWDRRKAFARLAEAGYVVAAENFRGTYLSEGTWVGYRALGWGTLQDCFDTVEWLAKQPWPIDPDRRLRPPRPLP